MTPRPRPVPARLIARIPAGLMALPAALATALRQPWAGRAILAALLLCHFTLSLFIANNCELAQHRFLFCLGSLCLPVFLLCCGRVVACLASLPLALVMIGQAYIIAHYHRLTYDICMAIAGTDIPGAITMLRTVPLWPVLLAMALLALLLAMTARVARFRPPGALLGLAGFGLTLSLGLHQKLDRDIAGHYNVAITWDSLHHRYVNNPYSARDLALYVNLPGPLGTLLATLALGHSYQQARTQPHGLSLASHEHDAPALLPGRTHGVRNIVLIIGESDAARHHALYGYQAQDTTPELKAMAARHGLCAIAAAHSAASMTHNAVPMMLSFLTPQDRHAILTQRNLIELARAHGYRTLWLGSHEGTSLYNSPFGYLSEFSEAVIRPDHSTLPLSVRENDDESLLPVLDHQLDTYRQEPEGRHFIIIHLIGSHASYREKATPADRRALPGAGSYDQAIHHTDHMLGTIIRAVEQALPEAAILYGADHGEILTSPDSGMHGVYDGGPEQYRIPVYLAGREHEDYCRRANNLRQDDGAFSQLMEKYLLLEMMGYRLDPARLERERQGDPILHSDGQTYDYNQLPGTGMH